MASCAASRRANTLNVVFALAIAVLYVPCRWLAGVKARPRSGWPS
jgi:hypothetical protein